MNISRRRMVHLITAAAALPVGSRLAIAQNATRPVRIVVGFPPGGNSDIHARLIGEWLSEQFGRSIIVENRPGAAGNIGAEAVARSAPDGYTLLFATSSDLRNVILYRDLKFNFIRDLAPVATISRGAAVLVVNPSSPVKSVTELIAAAKANPAVITVASPGVGTLPHLSLELFKSRTGTSMQHVPYRGEAFAITDLLGGQVQAAFSSIAGSIEQIKAGKLRPLGVTSAMRSGSLPGVPSIGEFVPSYEASGWTGIVAPRDVPATIIDTLNKQISAGLADPKIKQRLADLGQTVFANSPTEFSKLIADEYEKWAKVIQEANIKL